MSKRIQQAFYDVTTQVLRTEEGNEITNTGLPYIYWQEHPLLNIQLVEDDENTPHTEVSPTSIFAASIDVDFDHSTGLMMDVKNAGVNGAGTWKTIVDDAVVMVDPDPALGQITVQMNATLPGYRSNVGNAAVKKSNFELLVFDEAEELQGVYSFPYNCFNIQNPITAEEALVAPGEVIQSGQAVVPVGTDSVTVSGLALPQAWSRVIVTVLYPVADVSGIFFLGVENNPTDDGFVAKFSGDVPAGFIINYWLY